MEEWYIEGNRELSGYIDVSGAKNSLLAIIPATILTKSIVTLENVTPLDDTYIMLDILKKLNVRVIYDNKNKLIIDSRNVVYKELHDESLSKLRASYYFMGVLLSLFNKCSIRGPGGCKFASRPIDLHLSAFSALGYECLIDNNIYTFIKSRKRVKKITFSKVSVGATINAILASLRIKGKIVLDNVAMEPEIDDLINFLNSAGASIKRYKRRIWIEGKRKFHSLKYQIMKDRIEAGTYLVLGALIGKDLRVKYNEIYNISSLLNLFNDLNINYKVHKEYISVSRVENIKDTCITFDTFPLLATDMQQIISILVSRCTNVTLLKDKVYPTRYTQLDDLVKMGFKMEIKDGILYVYNSRNIEGKNVVCKDLRGGVSLIIAALIAKGKSSIDNVFHIKRGYFNMISKLKGIGAKIYEKDN